ncbi:NAD(P)-dependent oxidoreductase [Actinoplanes sp. N902-109]|uniref:NAD(P)-dependent oxidoreductase n=1 Tax=Actinoplanes sp. (strain N902-109) TaxID=649831 RepID=UPI00032949E6|nr:NAD(P)-dependent oxidoreductase [Actinoplanes sp. N902-109]AGL16640.1 3-hydroxyisobutyrate dehydrogenase [Actinoplanes sp. N902-109]
MTTDSRTFAVIGLGGMGAAMAHRLVATGVKVIVFNRTAAKAEPLVAAGASQAGTAAGAAAAADVVLLSLSDEQAVEDVLFGEVLPTLRPGTTVIDTSTVSPGYAREAARRLAEHGVARVEACVVGNPQMAKAGELRVFAAGEREHVDGVQVVLSSLGRQGFLHLGPAGSASALKLAFNLLLGAQTVALAEAVAFATRAGVDRELMLTAVVKSGFRSPVLAYRAEFMRTRRYEPAGFRARLMRKDLRLVTDAAAAEELALPLTEIIADRYAAVVDAGDGEKDAAIVLHAYERPQSKGTSR